MAHLGIAYQTAELKESGQPVYFIRSNQNDFVSGELQDFLSRPER